MNADALFMPECLPVQRTLRLAKDICALELVPAERGEARFGGIVELRKGTCLEVCGSGFNDRTIKAHCEGHFYFIFLRDIEPATEFYEPAVETAGKAQRSGD
jgi:hypothetical protein